MESCHSVFPPINSSPHPSTYCRRLPPKVYSTLGQLRELLEQLHSKEDLSSVLRDLVAEVDDGQSPPKGRSSKGQSPPKGQDSYIDLDPGTIIKISQILRKLNSKGCSAMQTSETHGTSFASSVSLASVSGETPGTSKVGGERVSKATTDGRNLSLSKQDSLYLMKKIRDFEQKCKPLQEKNKKFLERNMELTTFNRSLKEQIRNIADENKKMKEGLDQCKRKCSVLSQQLSQERSEKGSLEERVQDVEKLRADLTQHANTIANMKQVAAEKDRRMEVLQHRKKRRLRMSAEYISRLSSPCSVDDEPSQDSDLSFSSISTGGLSDDDILDELPLDNVEKIEKVEKNYKKLMKEHLAMQKSSAKLHGVLGWGTDHQRYVKSKQDFETDLYVSQCKIEQLEESLDKYKDIDLVWVTEKDQLSLQIQTQASELQARDTEIHAHNREIKTQADSIEELKYKLREATQSYEELKEQSEHLEFLVLETQEYNLGEKITEDAATLTEETDWRSNEQQNQAGGIEEIPVVEEEIVAEQVCHLEMAESDQDVYRATVKGLEEKLTSLLQGQGSEVATVMLQLKQSEQHVIDVIEVENTMQELQNKVILLQQANSGLTEKLAKCRERLDFQEQSLSLTKDEREELMQVKHKTGENQLNNRLRLAEMGQGRVRERSLEREGSWERLCSPLTSPRSPVGHSQGPIDNRLALLNPVPVNKSGENVLTGGRDLTGSEKHFDSDNSTNSSLDYGNDSYSDNQMYRRFRINSMPSISTDPLRHRDMFSEVDKLQRQIQELQDENDVLKFELTQKGHGDSDGSGSDSEDSRIAELRETCENLRERLQSAETMERQCKDRLKLAEKHIMELELGETVLRDRVEEGNTDCDKLRKQIVRLQRKIRELKDVISDKEVNEQALLEKLKFLEEAEALLSQKVTELEGTNQILKQRLDVKDELLADVHLVETLQAQVKTLQAENNNIESRLIDVEENNDLLRENWRKVADEDANRRECLEEKIRVLEFANNDLKTKLKEQETDLDLSLGPSIASEINEDTIEQLNERIKELENELADVREEKDKNIESLQHVIGNMKETEMKLTETLSEMENSEKELKEKIAVIEKSENTSEAASEMLQYEDKLCHMRSSQENLLDRLNSMENQEDELKDRIVELQKGHEKKLTMLEREIAEYQQQEDDLCARIEELEENENVFNDKIGKFNETEMNYKNKIEELENRETSLTIRFSQRVEELEQSENLKVDEIQQLQSENKNLLDKVNTLEKHEKELSEKCEKLNMPVCVEQENMSLLQSQSCPPEATVTVHEHFETVAKLESEASLSSKSVNQNSNCTDSSQADNQNLMDQISKLSAALLESEKEQKCLEEKLKRQEKKRKRSERADNTEDYDTIAREVVTYKMEVEQLRTENNELHDRIMELDESEKTMREKNEQLICEMESVGRSKGDLELSNEREQKLVSRINDLEAIEQALREELEQVVSVGNDSNHVSEASSKQVEMQAETSQSEVEKDEANQKEMVDKNVGTGDFMEGVMSGQDQGKPVSSMFERIQILETDNQELSIKLSSLTATDGQVRQLSDKVKSLEENEDSLMERVMELEDDEDRLKRELNKVKNSATSVSDLEEELTELQEKEDELNSTIDTLKLEYLTLQKSMESSDSEKGGIAVRLASVQKMYEDEKKKVESLLKGEEKWMKTVASEKKITKEMEEELATTQEKLEELQTEYESKLSEKDESEKVIKEELNKLVREREVFKKKLKEFEKSNSELEDEIEHCKISESRMFHRLQQLNSQNEELELKLSKLVKLIPQNGTDRVDGSQEKKSSSHLMSENPEVISENPLTSSIFTETELDLLRSKTPDYDLLGSVPLDMLRKMKDFDQREQNYHAKIKEVEQRNIKLVRNMKVLQSKEKDLKHEIKELQLELIKTNGATHKRNLRASTSSLDLERSGSEEDSDNQSSDGMGENEIFKADKVDIGDTDYDNMSQEELLLSVKLLTAKQVQDSERIEELEDQVNATRDLVHQVGQIVTFESLDTYLHSVRALTELIDKQDPSSGVKQALIGVLEGVTGIRHKLEALQTSEEQLRITLAENEIATERLTQESHDKVEQLEAQILVLAKLSKKYQNGTEVGVQVEPNISHQQQQQQQLSASARRLQLETSKTINIDVAPTARRRSAYDLQCLGQSETIRVNVPPSSRVNVDSEDDYSDTGYYGNSESTMMDKAEDVLRQRIRELEKLEKHLKQQVTDLECDREELHEIARKDKNIIHEQNVMIRELQLSQHNLQEQIRQFELSENSLYARLDSLEAEMDDKDDKIRNLEILEDRLKDLVKQYKLDEKILVTKSNTLESSVKEMSEKEETLRQKVQNLETEKCAFSERSEYLQLRLKELENAETDLAQRAKNQENIMQTLQNTVIELETFGANAHARVVELEHINFDLQQRLHHSMTENSPMTKKNSALQQQCDSMENELSALRDSEIQLRQENEAIQKGELALQQEVKVLRVQAVELEGKVRDLEEGDSIMKDKVSKLQRSENTLKYRVQELETSGIQAPSDLSASQSNNMKLPRTLEECQRRIIVLQANNAELQSRLPNNHDISGPSPRDTLQGTRGMVSLPEAEYQILQKKVKVAQQTENQLEESDRLNTHLQDTITQLREGKDVCGHEVETEVLRKRLDEANMSVKMLQNQNTGQWNLQGPNVSMSGAERSPGRERVTDLDDMIVEETMDKTSTGIVHTQRPPGQKLSRDMMLEDLLRSLGPSPAPQGNEDKHWHEIEARMEAQHRGGSQWISVGKATSMHAPDNAVHSTHHHRSHGNDEELELAVALQSETDSQINNYMQNDIDSGRYGNNVSPRLQRQQNDHYGSVNRNLMAPTLPLNGPPVRGDNLKVADGFGESLMIQDSFDELSDPNKEVMYRKSGGNLSHPSIAGSIADSGRGTASVSIATSGMTLRERIAHIERQLSARESDSAREFNSEIDLTSWKARVQETNRKLELAEKDNKHSKDEINKLEKDLEEKTRLYLHLEAFLKAIQTILADQNSANDGEKVKRVEVEVNKVVSNMTDGTGRPDDITHDPAALGSELAKKDRELTAKRNEADSLMRELRQWQQECRTIEDMRANALDSLRTLEVEVGELQMADKQLKHLKDDYNTLKGQFLKLVEAYRKLETVRHQYEDVLQERDDLDIDNAGLRSKVTLLEGYVKVLEGLDQEKHDLESLVLELKAEIAEYEKVEIEKKTLQQNLDALKELLTERMKKVESLTEEVFELRKKTSTSDRDNYKLRQENLSPRSLTSFNISSGNHSNNIGHHSNTIGHHSNRKPPIRGAKRAGEDDKERASVVMATHRAKILQLTNLCKEKDVLIKKLVQELKKLKSGGGTSPLVEELCRLENKSDHNHNRLGRSSSQSSLDSTDHMSIVSDTELLRESSPSLAQRPRSADIYHQRNAPHRASYHGHSNLPRHSRNSHHSASHRGPLRNNNRTNTVHSPHPPSSARASGWGNRTSDSMYRTTQYVAIADYDPSMFSQSGHPRLELSLKEGDIVLVTGPLHESGYVEGEVKGRVGLVPISYLQLSSPRRAAGNQRLVPDHLNASPERIAQLYNSLHNVHTPNTHVPLSIYGDVESDKLLEEIVSYDKLKHNNDKDMADKTEDLPLSKSNDIETLGENKGFHNGIPNGSTELPGNTRFVAMVTSPPDVPEDFHVEKIIGNSSLMLAWQPVHLDTTGCNNGVKVTGYKVYKNNRLLMQPRGRHAAKAVIENVNIQSHHRFGIQTVGADGSVSELSEIMYEGIEEVTSDENSDTESEMDMATVLNVDEFKTGQKRTYMGVYDYDPSKNSPYEHPSCELAFNAGDIITVYGRQRGDGFYYAEMNGVRGLVPTFFIEEMPQPPPRTKKIAARNKQAKKDKASVEKQDR